MSYEKVAIIKRRSIRFLSEIHLITALHQAGLATLTHTPSPMKFLTEILQRPSHERPFLLLVVGFPAEGALVPNIQRLPLSDIATFLK